MNDSLTIERSESQYPQGYDSNGRSIFYNDEAVARSRVSTPRPRLFRTRPLRFGSPEDLKLVDISSPMYDDIPSPHLALKEYIRTSYGKDEVPVYIFDDHNHAFFAWTEALTEGRIERRATLFHFDDHLDGRKPIDLPQDETLEAIARYSKSLDFNNFIYPAMRLGLVSETYWIDWLSRREREKYVEQETKFEIQCSTIGSEGLVSSIDFNTIDPKKTIVDIDLDYFTSVDQEQEGVEIQRIRKMIEHAGVVTFAISPGFIDEKRAIALVKKILET